VIPDDVVEEVRARADIVDIVGEFVSLKKSGKDYKALCPFHDEKTPSFYVVPAKGFYNCFGCGASGDVFSFLMEHQGMDFVEAVKHAGRRSGVEVEEVRRDGGEEDPHRHLYEVNAFARMFYQDTLWDEEEGAGARRYLEERGIDAETAERFELGYAPDEWRALREAASTHGIEVETLLEAGLLNRSEKASEPYDRFRNRIVFPILSVSGRVLGFGGRILGASGEGAPKYLNSPESPVYHKGEVLYGLNWAKHAIRRREAALVVEGYMDAVALAAAGLENVVAPLGTSMTGEQARLLSRYCTRVHLLFDSDPAGLRATFRAGDILLAAGMHPAVVTLPPGQDPDDVVRSEGAGAIREHVDQALDVLDRKIQILEERDYFSSIERTREAVDRLLPTIRAAADPALRDIYVAKVADRTGVRRETLEEELRRREERSRRGRSRRSRGASGGGRRRRGRRRGSGNDGTLPRMGAEREILRVLLRDPDGTYLEECAELLAPDDFVDPAYRVIYERLLDEPDLSRVPEGMDPVAAGTLEELLADSREIAHVRKAFSESVNSIRRKPLEKKYRQAQKLLSAAEEAGDEERVRELLEELKRLDREKREMGAGWESAAHKAARVSQRNEEERGR